MMLGLWVLPPRVLEAVSMSRKFCLKRAALLAYTSDHSRVWRSLSASVRAFDGELRLAC
jgi:hypothetical protein